MIRERPGLARALGVLYAAAGFAGTWAFFCCFILFLGNLPRGDGAWLWQGIDAEPKSEAWVAVLWNFGLVCLFGLQHSGMARPAFKKLLKSRIPPALERATYTHAANIAGFALILLWQPIPQVLWDINNGLAETLLWLVFACGWLILFAAAFQINLFDLLGLRQAVYWSVRRQSPHLPLRTDGIYAVFEHPMYVGVLLGLWVTPTMSVGHALLASQLTIYIAIAMRFERRDLEAKYGGAYAIWRTPRSNRTLSYPGRLVRDHPAALKRHLVWEAVLAEPLPQRMSALLSELSRHRMAAVSSGLRP